MPIFLFILGIDKIKLAVNREATHIAPPFFEKVVLGSLNDSESPVSFSSSPLPTLSLVKDLFKMNPNPNPKWSSSEILKIRLETTSKFIGFVDIQPNVTTLADVRRKISTDVEGGPKRYNFLLGDDVPISRRQEATQYASQLLPTATIRPAGGEPSDTTSKVMLQYQLEKYSSWLPANYTFQQLRQDACRYWKLRLSDVVLEDADGCAWPDRVEVESLVSLPLSGGEPFVVHVSLKDDSIATSFEGEEEDRPKNANNTTNTSSDSPSTSFTSTMMKEENQQHPTTPSNQGSPAESSTADLSGSDVESELWNIFSYYCVHGDTKEVQHLRRHHWLQLMRDIGLLGPTMGNSKSKLQAVVMLFS